MSFFTETCNNVLELGLELQKYVEHYNLNKVIGWEPILILILKSNNESDKNLFKLMNNVAKLWKIWEREEK